MDGNYDRIARFYDVDMARNMRFDDVGYYAAICAQRGGRVLELGCGTGRILLALLEQGFDAYGVDASKGMLAELRRIAVSRGHTAPVCRMDVRALGLAPGFSVILCPYSLVTYLTDAQDLDRLFTSAHSLLAPGGRFVVDTFVPRPVAVVSDWQLDYRRPHGHGFLARWKRIVPVSPELNRIERRYEVQNEAGEVSETIVVTELIRPVAPTELAARLVGAGFVLEQTAWNYAAFPPLPSEPPAQFVTYVARRVEDPGADD